MVRNQEGKDGGLPSPLHNTICFTCVVFITNKQSQLSYTTSIYILRGEINNTSWQVHPAAFICPPIRMIVLATREPPTVPCGNFFKQATDTSGIPANQQVLPGFKWTNSLAQEDNPEPGRYKRVWEIYHTGDRDTHTIHCQESRTTVSSVRPSQVVALVGKYSTRQRKSVQTDTLGDNSYIKRGHFCVKLSSDRLKWDHQGPAPAFTHVRLETSVDRDYSPPHTHTYLSRVKLWCEDERWVCDKTGLGPPTLCHLSANGWPASSREICSPCTKDSRPNPFTSALPLTAGVLRWRLPPCVFPTQFFKHRRTGMRKAQ